MFLYVLVAVVVLFVSRFLWRRWKYDLHKVPSCPGNLLFGHTLDFVFGSEYSQRALYFKDKFERLGYPKMLRFDIVDKSMLLVRDMAFIKNVMMSKTRPFPRVIDKYTPILPLLGNDVNVKMMVNATDFSPHQKAVRKIYAMAMQSQSLKKITPKMIQLQNKMVEMIDRQRIVGRVDLKELLTKYTLDVIGVLAFETNMGGLDGSRQFHQLFSEVMHISTARFKNPVMTLYSKAFPWSREARRMQEKIQQLNAEYADLVHHFQTRDDPPKGENPMWYALKTLKDEETGKPLSFKTLLAEIGTVVITGMDTTAQQLAWILMLLAAHPRVTEKLLEELKERGLYGEGSREVDFDDLSNLPYLTAIIKEGMRIAYVVSGVIPREVPEDMEILGYRIPKDTLIVALGTRSIQMKEQWGDPEAFRPERWLTGEDMSDKYYLAFSTGPRDCIGQRLAWLEMRLTIVKLMIRYELEIEEDWRELLDSASDGVIIEAENGVWFHVTPRKDLIAN